MHRLTIKDSIEERILALQEDKKKIADSVLGIEKTEGGARAARLNIKDLMSLFK